MTLNNKNQCAIKSLEVHKRIDDTIKLLFSKNLCQSDIFYFTSTVKDFLKTPNIKYYTLATVRDMVVHLSQFLLFGREDLAFSRKMIKIILSLGNLDIINFLETFLIKDFNTKHFFVLLQEKIKHKLDHEQSKKDFISILSIRQYELPVSDKFLEVINESRSNLLLYLIKEKHYTFIKKYVWQIGILSPESLREIIPIIIDRYDADKHSYYELIHTHLTHTNEYVHNLIYNKKYFVHGDFQDYLLKNMSYDFNMIKNYCSYLSMHDPSLMNTFEKGFLERANGSMIIKYSLHVDSSNKRQILKYLISMKDENYLIQFIKNFPEYEMLLPLL